MCGSFPRSSFLECAGVAGSVCAVTGIIGIKGQEPVVAINLENGRVMAHGKGKQIDQRSDRRIVLRTAQSDGLQFEGYVSGVLVEQIAPVGGAMRVVCDVIGLHSLV